jgi:hypothetical protein
VKQTSGADLTVWIASCASAVVTVCDSSSTVPERISI